MVDSMTDNRNRTVAEIRHIFGKNGCNLGTAGAVNWMFEKKGYIEDRLPNANMDPYVVTRLIIETVCGTADGDLKP